MLTGPLYTLFRRLKPKQDPFAMANPISGELKDHVVIAGSGRVGMTVAGILRDLGYPYILVEYDYHRYSEASEAGHPVIYGDSSQEEVLEAAKISTAQLVIITTPALVTARLIMNIVKHVNPGVDVIARSEGIRERDELYRSGVYEVVQPEFEAGLEIIRQALLHYEVSVTAIQNYLDAMRREALVNRPGEEKEELISRLRGFACMLEMEWFEVDENSPLADRTIGESNIRSQTGATVVIVARKGRLIHNPEVSEKIRVGDMVSVIGTAGARRLFREYATSVNPPQKP
jgi:CPA2 family monovalent cation:H+ antiporter-2